MHRISGRSGALDCTILFPQNQESTGKDGTASGTPEITRNIVPVQEKLSPPFLKMFQRAQKIIENFTYD